MSLIKDLVIRERLAMADEYFAPSLFINHGGGPYPVMGEQHNLKIAESLREVRKIVDFKRLKGIILVTAHWEADVVSISSNESHELLFDYYNFPPETYEYKYPAKGDPVLAHKVHDALTAEGIQSVLDPERGWDHGVFIPMMLIRPEADIPIVQVSILRNQDAKQHYELGRVLGRFRADGVAVIGSGLSYHNMPKMRGTVLCSEDVLQSLKFDDYLNKVCTRDEKGREEIVNWREAKGAFDAHLEGKADHLMPLIVAAGAGGTSKGRNVFKTAFLNKFMISSFLWDHYYVDTGPFDPTYKYVPVRVGLH